MFQSNNNISQICLIATKSRSKCVSTNPASFDDNTYECIIEGDGIGHHFGHVRDVMSSPKLKLHCKRQYSYLSRRKNDLFTI